LLPLPARRLSVVTPQDFFVSGSKLPCRVVDVRFLSVAASCRAVSLMSVDNLMFCIRFDVVIINCLYTVDQFDQSASHDDLFVL
jgi:hypothetical protein